MISDSMSSVRKRLLFWSQRVALILAVPLLILGVLFLANWLKRGELHAKIKPWSDSGVPGVSIIGRGRAQSAADVLQRIGERNAPEVLHALIAQLPGNFQPDRRSML